MTMAELHVPMSNHGPLGRTVYARVSLTGDGAVDLRLDADDESSLWRTVTLTTDEARAMAAALVHFADEAER